jgi:hypothetical protein
VLEYFISTHGGRKGLADTALENSRRRLPDPSVGGRGPRYRHLHGRLRYHQRDSHRHHSVGRRCDRTAGRAPGGSVHVGQRGGSDHRRPVGESGRDDHRGPGQKSGGVRHRSNSDSFGFNVRSGVWCVRQMLRSQFGQRQASGSGRSGGSDCRAVHWRAGHTVDVADVPHRWNGQPRGSKVPSRGRKRGDGQVHQYAHPQESGRRLGFCFAKRGVVVA